MQLPQGSARHSFQPADGGTAGPHPLQPASRGEARFECPSGLQIAQVTCSTANRAEDWLHEGQRCCSREALVSTR